MHLSGQPAVSIGGLNHVLHLGADPKTTSDAVGVWRDYANAPAGQPTAGGSFKWLFDLAAVGAMLVLLWVVFAETADATCERWRFLWPRLHLLRLQLIVVAFVAIVPSAHEQIVDLILRWAPGQLALTAALVWTFALLTWLIARRLLIRGQWQPRWGDDGRKQFGLGLFLTVLILTALQGYAEIVSGGSYRPGWGLAIPAVLLTGILILGLLLPALPPRPAPGAEALDPDTPHPRLPRGLAALIVVAFGLGVLHASFGPSVYARNWTWQTWELVALALVLGGAALARALHREPLVGGTIGAAVGLVLLRIADDGELAPSVLVRVALLFVVAGWRLYRAPEADGIPFPSPAMSWRVVLVVAAVLVALNAGIVARPFVLGPLSGVVGILLFFALVLTSVGDRAGILERSWERQWKHGELGQGLLQLWRTDHDQPLLLLNGTSVEDGCRFETWPLDVDVKTATVKNASVKKVTGRVTGCKSTEPFDDAGGVAPQSVLPATRDLGDFLCGQDKDVRLSTGALLSARFPFVNPAGRVPSLCPHPDAKPQVAYVVEGGYLDTSGASPIVELMTRLQPMVDGRNIEHQSDGTCIVPLMIQIDKAAEARLGAALLFGGTAPGAPDRYAHFVNEAHPGPKAPLGWTQSSAPEEELASQLRRPRNERAFEDVARWLRPGGLSCH